jgi:hypothetical protein
MSFTVMQDCKRDVTEVAHVTSSGSKRVMRNRTSPVLSVLVNVLVKLDGLTVDQNRVSSTFGQVSVYSQLPSGKGSVVSSCLFPHAVFANVEVTGCTESRLAILPWRLLITERVLTPQ